MNKERDEWYYRRVTHVQCGKLLSRTRLVRQFSLWGVRVATLWNFELLALLPHIYGLPAVNVFMASVGQKR